MSEFLQKVKPGDTVLVQSGFGRSYTEVTVNRTTPKFVFVCYPPNTYEHKYNKDTGKKSGANSWESGTLVEAVPDIVAKIRHRERVSLLTNYVWSKASPDTVCKVIELLEAEKTAKHAPTDTDTAQDTQGGTGGEAGQGRTTERE